MKLFLLICVFFSLIVLPIPLLAGHSLSAQLASFIDQHDILLLGEKHGRVESPRLMTQIVDQYTSEGKCLTVALEIDSSEQAAIDRVMTGAGSLEEMVIFPIIDSPEYREMLNQLGKWVRTGRCLKVVAVDGFEAGKSRDEWMAENLRFFLVKEKVLFLVGRLHAIKKIRWERGADRPFLGEILVRNGYDVCTVMQVWNGKGGRGALAELSNGDVERVLDPTSAIVPEDAGEVGDFVVRWE